MHKGVIGAMVAVIIVGGGAFYAGMSYAKGQVPTPSAGRGQFAGRGGMGARGGGGFTTGKIISVGNGSMTIQSMMSSSTEIVLLGGSTQIFKTISGSQTDLSQGANVVVTGTPNSDGSLSAQLVQIRPAGMMGFGSRPGATAAQ